MIGPGAALALCLRLPCGRGGGRADAHMRPGRGQGGQRGASLLHTKDSVNEHIQNTRVDAPPLAPHGRNTHTYTADEYYTAVMKRS